MNTRCLGVLWTLALAALLGGCRPTSAAAPLVATVAAPATSPEAAAPEAATPTPDTPAATPTLSATDASAVLAAMLPTVTPTPAASLPQLPAPWQPVSLRAGEPERAVAAEAILPSGERARTTLFALRADGLDLHGYLRSVQNELAAQTGILLLDARLDDTFRADGLPIAHLSLSIWPAQGEPLAAIQIAYLEREHFIVVTVSAPEPARAELEAALHDLYASITAE